MYCTLAISCGTKSNVGGKDGCPVPPSEIVHPGELVWFDVVDSVIVTCWAEGIICSLDLQTKKVISRFKIAGFSPDNYHASSIKGYGWFLSAVKSPKIAFVDGCDIHGSIVTYDLLSGKKTQEVIIDTPVGFIVGHGFDKDGKSFFVSSDDTQFIACVDMQAGKKSWVSEFCDHVQTSIKVLSEGASYAVFGYGHISVIRKDGTRMWRKDNVLPDPFDPVHISNQIVCPLLAVRTSHNHTEVDCDIVAISVTDGSVLWEKKEIEFDALRAVTDDGNKQAFWINGMLEISHLPRNDAHRVQGIPGPIDAVFSKDGNYLYCVASLLESDNNKETYQKTFERKSQQLFVINANTGKVLDSIDLKSAHDK